MTDADPRDWTPYWQKPTITSFGDMFPDNYDDSFLEFWQQQLVGDFDHVLDVACGNGALTWIANSILNSGVRQTRITGVDFADIDPFKVLGRQRREFPAVRFIGNTPAERLPFSDQSIDLVISQYGLEYTDLEKTVPELARVLGPEGRMSFILHDKESTIIKGATFHLDDYRTVLNELVIHDFALALDALYQRMPDQAARQQSTEHRELVLRINRLAGQVRAIVRDYPPRSPIHLYMERLNQALAQARNNAKIDRRALIIEARDRLRSHIERIEDLEASALSAMGRQRLIDLIEAVGFTVTKQAVLAYRQEANVGTILVAQR